MGDYMEKRRESYFEIGDAREVSARVYNLIIGLVVLYGLFVNVLLCDYASKFVNNINPIVFLIGYFVCGIGGCYISIVSSNPLISFIGYNLVVVPVGLVAGIVIESYGGLHSSVVKMAFFDTASITFIMIAISCIKPEFFLSLGKTLFTVLLSLVIVEVILLFLGVIQIWTSVIAAGVFCLYIGYDFQRAQQYPKTFDNAVDNALDIYLDIINLFLRLLRQLGRKNSD